MLALSDTPPETWNEVFQHVSEADLYSLALVHPAFRDVAQKRLFREVAGLSTPRIVMFLEAIVDAPHLGRSVRKLFVRPGASLTQRFPFHLLWTALAVMPGLRGLDIEFHDLTEPWLVPEGVLTTLVQVRLFNVPLDSAISKLLIDNPMLKSVSLHGDEIGQIVVPAHAALPQLQFVAGSPEVVASLVPGRCVSQVQVFLRTSGLLKDWEACLSPLRTAKIETLVLREVRFPHLSDVVWQISKQWPHLTFLEIHMELENVAMGMPDLSDVLRTMNNLKILVIKLPKLLCMACFSQFREDILKMIYPDRQPGDFIDAWSDAQPGLETIWLPTSRKEHSEAFET